MSELCITSVGGVEGAQQGSNSFQFAFYSSYDEKILSNVNVFFVYQDNI